MKYLSLILLVLLSSCFSNKPTRKHKRALRMVARAKNVSPAAFAVDTVHFYDTIVKQEYRFDTVHSFVKHDTVVVHDTEKYTVKYFYDTITDNLSHEIIEKTDTIYIDVPLPVPKLVELSLYQQYKNKAGWLVLIIILAFILIRIFKPPK